ncbi:MAG: hypothetical protein ACK4M3_02050 [Pyrobaculum sp.]
MVDLLLLAAALFFGILTVFSRDNVFSAASLAAAAGAVGVYYAYLSQFAAAFLICVIYIGAVMLLVIITAAMYGGVERWRGRHMWLTSALLVLAAIVGAYLWSFSQASPAFPTPHPGELTVLVVFLLGVAAVSLVVGIEVARRP